MTRILLVLGVIFSGLLSVIIRGHGSLSEVLRTTTVNDLTDGRFAQRIDKAIFNAVPRSIVLDGLVSGIEYRLLGDAGPQVRAGCGDWLFSMEELREERHAVDNMALRAELLRRLAHAVERSGARLIILPVPDKAAQVEDGLCGLTAAQSRLRDKFWAEFGHMEGADVVDLRNDWPHPGYWKTDTHWDQTGARFAAERIAQSLARTLEPAPETVTLIEGQIRDRVGDLAKLSGLSDAPRALAPQPEQERELRADISRSGGLLDDMPAPAIILAGSSFSLNSGFLEYLQNSLAREVTQVSRPGGGFAGALLELVEKRPGALEKAKVVIWEWPMRSLVFPPTEAEKIYLGTSR